MADFFHCRQSSRFFVSSSSVVLALSLHSSSSFLQNRRKVNGYSSSTSESFNILRGFKSFNKIWKIGKRNLGIWLKKKVTFRNKMKGTSNVNILESMPLIIGSIAGGIGGKALFNALADSIGNLQLVGVVQAAC